MPDRVEALEKDESEYVRRWKPDDLCDLDRNESWFSDMAEQGLFVDHFTRWSVWFKRGTPQKTRYRMDVLSRELTEDELALYDSAGWHFAALARESHWRPFYFYIFQTDENSGVPELHTDPMEQAESLKKLRQAMRWEFWFGVAATTVLLGITALENGWPELRFDRLVTGNLAGVNGGLMIFLCFLETLRGWMNVRRLHRRLAEGEALDHRADYHKAHRRFRLTNTLRWALPLWLLAMMAAQLIATAASGRALPLPTGEADFPAVRLEEVYDSALAGEGVSGNLYHEWTLAGAVIDRLWEEGNAREDYSILQLNTVCIRLPFAKTAERAFAALTEMDTYMAYRLEGIAPVETNLADEVWAAPPAAENRNQFILLVRDGRRIVMTFYLDRTNGDFDDPVEAEAFRDRCMERLLPMLAQKLED